MAMTSMCARNGDAARRTPGRPAAVPPTAAPVGARAAAHPRTGSARPFAAITSPRALIAAQESERRRLAHELHDVVGQALTVVRLNLEAAAKEDHGVAARLAECLAVIDRTLEQVRAFARELGPSMLDDHGLAAAIHALAARSSRDAQFTVSLEMDQIPRLDPALESSAYRVIQEALTNVVRHARASTVAIRLRLVEGALELMVRDDGAGFSVKDALARARAGESLGLLGMYERARLLGGALEVLSAAGHGTRVRASFPSFGAATDQAFDSP